MLRRAPNDRLRFALSRAPPLVIHFVMAFYILPKAILFWEVGDSGAIESDRPVDFFSVESETQRGVSNFQRGEDDDSESTLAINRARKRRLLDAKFTRVIGEWLTLALNYTFVEIRWITTMSIKHMKG